MASSSPGDWRSSFGQGVAPEGDTRTVLGVKSENAYTHLVARSNTPLVPKTARLRFGFSAWNGEEFDPAERASRPAKERFDHRWEMERRTWRPLVTRARRVSYAVSMHSRRCYRVATKHAYLLKKVHGLGSLASLCLLEICK